MASPHSCRAWSCSGGGFGGVYTALHLERLIGKGAPLQVSLVNRENYLVFQPMLAEVIAGDVGILDTVSPLRQLLGGTDLFVSEIDGVDLERRVVTLGAGLTPRRRSWRSTIWSLALGNVTDFRGVPGLPEHALPFKTLADAVRIRNHVIHVLEQCSVVSDPDVRRTMLTFVVAGGGFSGTEVAAALNDFVRRAVGDYRSIPREDVRIVLVHSGSACSSASSPRGWPPMRRRRFPSRASRSCSASVSSQPARTARCCQTAGA